MNTYEIINAWNNRPWHKRIAFRSKKAVEFILLLQTT